MDPHDLTDRDARDWAEWLRLNATGNVILARATMLELATLLDKLRADRDAALKQTEEPLDDF